MQNNTFSSHSYQQDILVLDKTDSTNTYLKNYLSKFKPLEEFTAIMTLEQTAGRGLRGNSWNSPRGQNLTFSILLYPKFLSIKEQFLLSACISLSIHEMLLSFVDEVKIKWPNDLYVRNKKIGGILIENTLSSNGIKHSIVGIGLNINQLEFDESLKSKATSLGLLTGESDYDLLTICKKLIDTIKRNYHHLKTSQNNFILKRYNENLFQKNQQQLYTIDNQTKKAKIVGVEIDGLLALEVDNAIKKYDLKELTYII